MNVADNASTDVNTNGGGTIPPSTGLIPDALPEVQKSVWAENSQTGVSTRNVLSPTGLTAKKSKDKDIPHWYALRTTYSREKKAYDYMVNKGATAFYPTLLSVKLVDGKRKPIEESRIPNIFFAYGTEDYIKSFVYDNVNLPYLRFYYHYFHVGNKVEKEPLVVSDSQIESLKIICASEASDVILIPTDLSKFRVGQSVRVIDGNFMGVIGKVARFHGQQRVAVVIDGLLTVATAYIPSAFLEEII